MTHALVHPDAHPGAGGEGGLRHRRFQIMAWRDAALPAGLTALVDEAEAAHAWMSGFMPEWTVRPFVEQGEALFVAFDQIRPMAMAVVSKDPYLGAAHTGRLRFIYVARAARGEGLARVLIEACLRQGAGVWRRLRLHTENPRAVRLYESYGFRSVDEPRTTHARQEVSEGHEASAASALRPLPGSDRA